MKLLSLSLIFKKCRTTRRFLPRREGSHYLATCSKPSQRRRRICTAAACVPCRRDTDAVPRHDLLSYSSRLRTDKLLNHGSPYGLTQHQITLCKTGVDCLHIIVLEFRLLMTALTWGSNSLVSARFLDLRWHTHYKQVHQGRYVHVNRISLASTLKTVK